MGVTVILVTVVLGGWFWCRPVIEKLTCTLIHPVASYLLPGSTSKLHKVHFTVVLAVVPPRQGSRKIPVDAQMTARIESCTYMENSLLICRVWLPLSLPDGPA